MNLDSSSVGVLAEFKDLCISTTGSSLEDGIQSLLKALERLLDLRDKKWKITEPKTAGGFGGFVFQRALECEVQYDQKLKDKIAVFVERVGSLTSEEVLRNSQLFRQKLIALNHEPRCTIQRENNNADYFKVDSAMKVCLKSEYDIRMEPANAQHKQLYYCLYVVALLQNAGSDKIFEQYRLSFEDFKALHRNEIFEVRRARNDDEGDKKKVRAYYKMHEFDEREGSWELLYQFRNVFFLCFIISPGKNSQKNLFINVASILLTGRRAAQGGKPSMFTTAVGNVVFNKVSRQMFNGYADDSTACQEKLRELYQQQIQREAEFGKIRKPPAKYATVATSKDPEKSKRKEEKILKKQKRREEKQKEREEKKKEREEKQKEREEVKEKEREEKKKEREEVKEKEREEKKKEREKELANKTRINNVLMEIKMNADVEKLANKGKPGKRKAEQVNKMNAKRSKNDPFKDDQYTDDDQSAAWLLASLSYQSTGESIINESDDSDPTAAPGAVMSQASSTDCSIRATDGISMQGLRKLNSLYSGAILNGATVNGKIGSDVFDKKQ